MDVQFLGPQKLIVVNPGVTTLSAKDLYSWWKQWAAQGDNLKYPQAMSSVGGDPLPGDRRLGSTFFLENGWKIRPYEGNHQLLIDGNLYTRDGSSPFVQTLGNYNVVVSMSVSQLTEAVVTSSGGGSGSYPTPTQIAAAVWNHDVAGATTPGGFGKLLKKVLTIPKFIGLK